jgi:HEAT repeat protein
LIEVTRVLKGVATEGELARVAFAEDPDRLPMSLTPGETVILFLRAPQQGVYTLVDPFVGKMPVTSRHVAAPPNATTTGLLETEIMASLDDSDREVARVALEQVGNLGRVSSTQALQGIANAGDPEFRALAYAALVRLHDYSAWDAAIAFAATPSADERLQQLQLLVAEAVRSTRDASMVPRLGELLSSGTLPLRRAAASALRSIGDPSSLPYLALALNDDDVDVRYNAMMAIAQMEGSPSAWTPARDAFEQDQITYLQHWQNWWRSRNQ